MSAVIRVKRRCDEDPLDALVLNCKRRKTEDGCGSASLDDLSTILKFAGTLETQEEDVLIHIKKQTKVKCEETFKSYNTSIKERLREQVQLSSKVNRYKVVNLCRSSTGAVEAEQSTDKGITIVDIETKNETNVDNSKYVYDLYYSNADEIGDVYEHDLIGIYPLSDELVYGSYRDNGLMDSDNESEDSNDENNWRNDYPDEEDVESVTEEDMISAAKRITLKEDDLSSDGEEGFIYSIDSESAGFEEDIDDSDVHRYGERYARFKARNKDTSSESYNDHDYDDEDDDFKDYYD